MARLNDPMRELGTVREESDDQARRRRRREYDVQVEDRALELVKHDPEVGGDMRKAKRKAREMIALENQYEAGTLDTDEDKPGKKKRVRKSTTRRPRPAGTSRRPASGTRRNVRKTARTVTAPFGNAASAGWTFFQGGLSLVLLYVVLRNAGSLSAFANGISIGIKRFSDPTVPLLPTKGESSPPPVTRRRVHSTHVTKPPLVGHGHRTQR